MPRKVLIVEDHPETADLQARIMRMRFGGEVSVMRDGIDAINSLREHGPDLLLLDLMLPDISGIEVCRRLRAGAETVLTPIVIVTALHDTQFRIQGFEVGANAYITKPYAPDELFNAAESAWAWQARMEREPREGEIAVEVRSEIRLLQGLNDLRVHLICSKTYNAEQASQFCQAVPDGRTRDRVGPP